MTPGLLVLDFDGVVCDGIDEMGESASRALAEVTRREVPPARRAGLQARFAALRPVIESGWEMVVLVGVLTERAPAADAELRDGARWAETRDGYMRRHALERTRLAAAFDAVRDRWLKDDRHGWLARHRFYDGIAAWLSRLVDERRLVYVLSTKGKPFLDALLAGHDVRLPTEQVIGKAEPKREKWDVLRELAASHHVDTGDVWFVEDRLATLLDLRRHAPDLRAARLFLAEWGYIFRDRDPAAARAAGIPVLTLPQATGRFEGWVRMSNP
jgi:phosphoglycolate phosphatase-like HAD superfamily hydrolase